MPSHLRGLAMLGGSIIAVTGLTAGPALASGGAASQLRGAASASRPLSAARATSPQIAGWIFNKSGTTTSTVTFKEPRLACSGTNSGVAPGIVVISGTASRPTAQAAQTLDLCIRGLPPYIPALTVNGFETNFNNPVAAGDLMRSTVAVTPAKVTVTLSDLTAPRKFTLTKSATNPGSSLQEQFVTGAVFSTSGLLPVPNFGTIGYTGGSINNVALGQVTPAGFPVDRQTGAVLQISTSALVGPKKDAFSTVFKHS